MIITTAQIEALSSIQKEKFIAKTIAFLEDNLPEWAANKSNDELKTEIEKTIVLGKERNIKKEINIQKLLYYRIKYSLSIPFSAEIDAQLIQEGVGENYRIKAMIKVIRESEN